MAPIRPSSGRSAAESGVIERQLRPFSRVAGRKGCQPDRELDQLKERKTHVEDRIVSEDLARRNSPCERAAHERWVRDQGLDIIGAQYVPDLKEGGPEALAAARRQCRLHQSRRVAHVERLLTFAKFPTGKKLEPQRQLYEEMVARAFGRGSTTVWNDSGDRLTFEWKAGAMFAIPLNAWYQHF